jgi:tetratricopeptide (TPR) repeat protein
MRPVPRTGGRAAAVFAAAALLLAGVATAHDSHQHEQPSDDGKRAELAAADRAQAMHDFRGARAQLDRLLAAHPQDVEGRLMRANLGLLAGEFAAARRDCIAVIEAGSLAAGTICLASTLTGPGSVAEARRLIGALGPVGDGNVELQRWRLLTEADLASRAGDTGSARRLFEHALALDARHDEARTQFAEFLLQQGEAEGALELAQAPDASPARLVVRLRAAIALDDPRADAWRSEIGQLFASERRRGIPPHLREEGQVALYVDGDAAAALALAQQNFATQKDTRDLRLLADAALAHGDPPALDAIRGWLSATGFEDHVVARRL